MRHDQLLEGHWYQGKQGRNRLITENHSDSRFIYFQTDARKAKVRRCLKETFRLWAVRDLGTEIKS